MIDKMTNKTKIISVGILLLLLCSLIMATFTDTFIMNDLFRTGNVEIKIDVQKLDSQKNKVNLSEVEYVNLGKDTSYISSIKNISEPSYIRVKLEYISEDNSISKYIDPSNININSNIWTFKDDYFYCNEILKENETIEFTNKICFDDYMFNNLSSSILKLKITAEAIQSKNIDDINAVWDSEKIIKTETMITNSIKDGN